MKQQLYYTFDNFSRYTISTISFFCIDFIENFLNLIWCYFLEITYIKSFPVLLTTVDKKRITMF